jgi:hypothetical protein
MKLTAIVLGAVLLLGLSTTAHANEGCVEFCTSDSGPGLKIMAVGVAGAYVGVTAGMGIKDLVSDDHSVGYGWAETVIHAPLALVFGAATVNELGSTDKDAVPWLIGFTALHTALAAHGVYTLGKDRSARPADAPGGFQVGRVSAAVAPTPVQGGAGLGIGGTF